MPKIHSSFSSLLFLSLVLFQFNTVCSREEKYFYFLLQFSLISVLNVNVILYPFYPLPQFRDDLILKPELLPWLVYLDLGRFILMPWFSSFLAAFACMPRSGETSFGFKKNLTLTSICIHHYIHLNFKHKVEEAYDWLQNTAFWLVVVVFFTSPEMESMKCSAALITIIRKCVCLSKRLWSGSDRDDSYT